MQSSTPSHPLDQELEDTFPASDPPSMSTPSIATTRDSAQGVSPESGWLDLYCIRPAPAHGPVAGSDPGGGALLDSGAAQVRFGTSAALALLHHIAERRHVSKRVRLISARVELTQIATSSASPGGESPHAPPNDSIARGNPPPGVPGRFAQSTLSPADREVLWDTTHADADALRVVSQTTFDLDPRLLETWVEP